MTIENMCDRSGSVLACLYLLHLTCLSLSEKENLLTGFCHHRTITHVNMQCKHAYNKSHAKMSS